MNSITRNKVNSVSSNEKVTSKTFATVLKSFFIILLINGFNYNFFQSSRLVQYTLIGYCVCVNLFWIFIYIFTGNSNGVSLTLMTAVEFCFDSCVTIFTRNCVMKFYDQIADIDCRLKIDARWTRMRHVLYIVLFVLWTAKVLFSFFNYNQDEQTDFGLPGGYSTYINFYLFSIDIYRVWRLSYQYVLQDRLSVLRKRVQSLSKTDVSLFRSKESKIFESKLIVCLQIYKDLVSAADVINTEFHPVILFAVCCMLPKTLFNMYYLLYFVENQTNLFGVIFRICNLLQSWSHIILPCIIVELQLLEVDRIKCILVHQLTIENDESTKTDIINFLDYIEQRDFRFKMWRLVSLDIAFPMNLANIITNYIIVMVNFARLY